MFLMNRLKDFCCFFLISFILYSLFLPYSYSEVTIKTGEVNMQYIGFFNKGIYYSEKDEPLNNYSSVLGSINNLQLKGQIYKDKIFFDSIFNVDFNNQNLVEFKYNRVTFIIFDNLFILGSLPINFTCAINNTNNIYGIMWQFPLLPEKQLNGTTFGAKLKEGFDSPYYSTYLYGANLSSEIGNIKLDAFYCKIQEQEEAIRYNSILQPNFMLTKNTINKLTAKHSKGTIRRNVTLDMDSNPYLEISIVDTGDRNIGWEIEVDNGSERITIQYITKQSGIFKYNLKSPTGWAGNQSITIYIHFYNSPYDLSDNSLYIDYVKIYNSSGILFNFEDFSSWTIPDDVEWSVLNKEEVITSLPSFYFPFNSQFYGFTIKKNRGNIRGTIDIVFNETYPSPIETQKGYFVNSKLTL